MISLIILSYLLTYKLKVPRIPTSWDFWFSWFDRKNESEKEMAKQFVTEIHQENSVVILLNGVDAKRYNRNPLEFEGYNNPILDGVPEYTEITEENKVHYWIRVPDFVSADEKSKSQVFSYKERKAKEKQELIRLKNERIARYKEMISSGKEIVPTAKDIEDGLKLAQLQKRKIKDRSFILKSLNSPVSAIGGENVYEDDYFPDADFGIIGKNKLKLSPFSPLSKGF